MTTGDADGRAAVRPEIAMSWKRSLLSGVDPGRGFDASPAADLDLSGRLLRAARPVLDEVGVQIAGTELCVLLADPDCRIVARVFDTGAVERRMERLGVLLGSRFGEDRAGTNAIGTPLEVRRGIVINGEEHYLEQFKDLSCYGHPIIHPVTHRVEGILDMTCIAPQVNSLFAPFLQRAAADIERRLLEGARASEQRLVDAFQRVSPQRQVAVTAIGEDILLSNRAALDLLDVADHATLRGLATDLKADQSRTVQLELASGEVARVRADRIAGTDGGTLFLVQPVQRQGAPIRRRGSRTNPPAAERVRAELERLRDTCDALVVYGEPGSGRSTAVQDIAATRFVYRHDASRIAVQGIESWTHELARSLQRSGEIVVVDHVQLLPESVHPLVSEAIAVADSRIVLVCSPEADLAAPVAALVARCPEQLVVPPLRQRCAEFPEISGALLDEIAPGVRLTATALTALTAAQWPGNLTELRVVLTQAARSCAGKRITLTDLPDRYRTPGRVARLAGRERAERQAIVDALTECGGNKVHAAEQLGISRSTLYARIRALEITT
ncbi:sigma-54-dependent Fis family transcriptional regulator [Rhodococcus sp. NPDC127528]|uniref:sigma-54-dependent Fis family transcriptional regulator n=1 Tax=unclassified Rhodococcus (in: high G+C Gram-positive bacteria) TaxID=192944 RepID=UPI00363A63BE